MKDPLAELGIRFRDFRPEDIPALVEVSNRTYPDEPTTVAQEEHWERIYPEGNPRRRIVAETAAGHNDTANPPILRLNEKLGYRRLPGWLIWEKRFTTAKPG